MIKYIVFSFLFCTSIIFTQNFTYKHYSLEDGLPVRQVFDVIQDSTGLMWFATEYGIMTYDGTEWYMFNKKYPELHFRLIKIKMNKQGEIYFAPYEYRDPILMAKENEITEIPFLISDKKKRRITAFDVLDNLIAVGFADTSFYLTNNSGTINNFTDNLPFDFINDIDHLNNTFYLATTKGLFSLSDLSVIDFNKINIPLKNLNIYKIDIDKYAPNLSYYGLNSNSIFEYTNNKLNIIYDDVRLPKYYNKKTGYAIKKLSNSNIYYYGEQAILKIYNSDFTKRILNKLDKEISYRGITSICEDMESNVWISSVRGIHKIKQNIFKNLNEKSGLYKSEVSAISQADNGDMVFGHNGGFTILTKDKYITKGLRHSDKGYDRILDISKRENGEIWFVIGRRGVGFLDRDYNINLVEKFDQRSYSVFWDSKDELWIGQNKNLIINYDDKLNEKKRFRLIKNSLVRNIYEFENGFIHLATSKGLYVIDRKDETKTPKLAGMAHSTYCVSKMPNGDINVGTLKGFFNVKDTAYQKVLFSNFDLDFPVYSSIEENDSTYWLGTEKGLLRWNLTNNEIVQFTMADGLSGNETNRAANFIDRNNHLWIGTDRGVSSLKLGILKNTKYKPKATVLYAQNLEGEKIEITSPVELPHSSNSLIFHYRGHSFIDETRNVFKIELIDESANIVLANETSEAKYLLNSISPGEYYFRVKVKSANGIWSDPVSSALIKIGAPLYQEPWFISISIFVLGLIGFYINEYRVSRRYSKKLEIEVNERTRLLSMSEKRYKKLLETSPVSILMTDSVNKILFCNDQTYEQFGYPQDCKLEGLDFSKFVHKSSIKEFNEILFGTFQYETIREQELNFMRNDKSTFPGMINSTVIYDEKEDKINIIYTIKDTTIYKKVENRLKNINKDLETLVDQKTSEVKALLTESPFAIAIFSPDGTIDEINTVFRELFESKNIDSIIEGYNVFEDNFLIDSEYFEIVKNIFKEGGTFTSPIIPLEINKDDERWIRARLYSIHGNEKVEKIVGMIEEVTQRKKMEEMSLKLIEQKKNAAAIIGAIDNERARISRDLHDGIGQLLTGIKIKVDSYEIEHGLQHDGLGEIGDLLSQAGSEIRNIIYDLHPVVIENYGLLFALKNICNRLHQNTDIEVKFDEQNYFGSLSKKDELPIFRIIQECLNNIVKHAQCNNVTVRINEDLDQKNIKIEVIDDGVGFNISEVENKAFGITGLKQRTDFLNGEIIIISEVGKGTKINLTVPI